VSTCRRTLLVAIARQAVFDIDEPTPPWPENSSELPLRDRTITVPNALLVGAIEVIEQL
jgi:hypothetical protein